MDSRYDHQLYESKIYDMWEKRDAFNPDSRPQNTVEQNSDAKSFTIMMPPPNANDPLHIGHAMFITLEDILIRWHRMMGDDTLWLPGTDHAGIETQFVFEKKLKKQNQSRFQFDRQTLYQMIWNYVQENSDVAVNQMKKIGASADWSRFMFMLDEANVKHVLETFVKMHKDGLIYRDLRLVNYCTHCGTAFSDLEINHIDQTTPLYYVKYRMADNPEEYITVATVRPEPIWADTHLAVHPTNKKNKHLIGKQVLNPLTDQPMTIIADEFVDPEFGTGIVKLTPAHDPNDFAVAQKHDLPIVIAFTTQGRIAPGTGDQVSGPYAGMKIKAARAQVVTDLEAKGLIDKVDNTYQNRIGTCYRCKNVIEPLPLPQFFIKVEPLTTPILKALKNKEFKVHGAGHDKILKHWLENLKDWNISRQIVWGIRMPIWYSVTDNPEIDVTFLDSDDEKVVGKLGELLATNYTLADITKGLQELNAPVNASFVVSLTEPDDTGSYIQETDTFDTWFSSAQWPFSTLKALDIKNIGDATENNFDRFYPTQVMETGYDILPFWVMRMLMVGNYATGQLPFKDIYLHGLVRDQKGQKMSKSKGNVINPLAIIDQYGADALRMALVIRSSAGLDKSVGDADFRAMRNLGNKIWNASRFIMLSLGDKATTEPQKHDAVFTKKLSKLVALVTKQLHDYKLGLAAETVYNEFWHWYCDDCIELAKEGKISRPRMLSGLVVFLQLLHPFVPFVTEAVWQELQTKPEIAKTLPSSTLATSSWPIV